MSEETYLWAVILIMAVVTFLSRAIPFVAFRNSAEHPVLTYLGCYMPPMIMLLLVLYSLQSVDLGNAPYGLYELAALTVTVVLHLWRGNALLSIFAGTGLYMCLVQWVGTA